MVEAADTGPFFHNNAIDTIEGAVAFYNGDAFNTSPAGQLIIGATGSGINLESTQVVEVAAFLRVINALENIRASDELLDRAYLVSQTDSRRFWSAQLSRSMTVSRFLLFRICTLSQHST